LAATSAAQAEFVYHVNNHLLMMMLLSAIRILLSADLLATSEPGAFLSTVGCRRGCDGYLRDHLHKRDLAHWFVDYGINGPFRLFFLQPFG